MKVNEFFDLREFVHPKFYDAAMRMGSPEIMRWYISQFQINYALLLRQVLGAPIIANNWHVEMSRAKRYVGRGTRPMSYRPSGGAELSQHYLANALDVSCPAYSERHIFEAIQDNYEAFAAIGLTTIEDVSKTPGWLHADCRTRVPGIHPTNGFLIVKP